MQYLNVLLVKSLIFLFYMKWIAFCLHDLILLVPSEDYNTTAQGFFFFFLAVIEAVGPVLFL